MGGSAASSASAISSRTGLTRSSSRRNRCAPSSQARKPASVAEGPLHANVSAINISVLEGMRAMNLAPLLAAPAVIQIHAFAALGAFALGAFALGAMQLVAPK